MTRTLDVLKADLITNIKQQYQSSLNAIIDNYNKNVAIIQKSRSSSVQKNISIARLNATKTSNINALLNQQQQYINNIHNYSIPPVQILNKKALCIGINYTGTPYQLEGCNNDALDVQKQLLTYGFSANNIQVMTDNTIIKPTKTNILKAFTNLLSNAKQGDLVVFSSSSHGTQTQDKTKTELDGLDECIVSLDLNIIYDYEFKNIIQKYLQPGVSLFALFDSCFSGSVLDLRYLYDTTTEKYSINMNDSETYGNVIMISGCTDSQTSADAYIGKPQGACTWAFLKTLNDNPKELSWLQLVKNMNSLLVKSDFTQTPELSCGSILDLDSTIWFQ